MADRHPELEQSRFLSCKRFALATGHSEGFIKREAAYGRIPSVRTGRGIRIPVEAAIEALAAKSLSEGGHGLNNDDLNLCLLVWLEAPSVEADWLGKFPHSAGAALSAFLEWCGGLRRTDGPALDAFLSERMVEAGYGAADAADPATTKKTEKKTTQRTPGRARGAGRGARKGKGC